MLNHKGTKRLETNRLILRKATLADAEPMFRNWASDPEVTKFLTWPPHENMDVTRTVVGNWVESYHKEDYYHWMIVLKETGEPIGSLLASCVGRVPSAHIGYCIGKNW
jgi:ribosomal-protein-alanine N-acetyltransferase